MIDNIEIWKDIPGFEGKYQISTFGRVSSIKNHIILKQRTNNCGYSVVSLYNQYGERKHLFVHRLVAQSFIPNPDNLPQVNHLDEDKSNCRVTNLCWVSSSQNLTYGSQKLQRSVPVMACDKHGNIILYFDSLQEATKKGFSQSGISNCASGRTKTYKGYIWKRRPKDKFLTKFYVSRIVSPENYD